MQLDLLDIVPLVILVIKTQLNGNCRATNKFWNHATRVCESCQQWRWWSIAGTWRHKRIKL